MCVCAIECCVSDCIRRPPNESPLQRTGCLLPDVCLADVAANFN